MKTIELTRKSDDHQILKLELEVPVDRPDCSYQVTFLIEESQKSNGAVREWPTGYMESVIGSWQGEFPEVPDMPLDEVPTL